MNQTIERIVNFLFYAGLALYFLGNFLGIPIPVPLEIIIGICAAIKAVIVAIRG